MGETPPDYAATLIDSSVPLSLEPDQTGVAWAVFRNDGTSTWLAGEVWLGAMFTDKDGSQLYDQNTWVAHDVAAVLYSDVEPGDTGTFEWSVRMPQESASAAQSFRMMDPVGAWLMCPSPGLDVDLHSGTHNTEPDGSDVSEGNRTRADREGAKSCQVAAGAALALPSVPWVSWWMVGALAWFVRRSRTARPARS